MVRKVVVYGSFKHPTTNISIMATMATELASVRSSEIWTWTNQTKYADGSNYKGYVDRFGKRTGTGILRTPVCVYGEYEPTNPSAILNWMEYKGGWRNDKPYGWGILLRCRGDGTSTTSYKGIWVDGEPKKSESLEKDG